MKGTEKYSSQEENASIRSFSSIQLFLNQLPEEETKIDLINTL